MKVKMYREWNPWAMTRPKLVRYFSGDSIEVGASLDNGHTDPVLSAVLVFDELPPWFTGPLAAALSFVERSICHLTGRHHPRLYWIGEVRGIGQMSDERYAYMCTRCRKWRTDKDGNRIVVTK